MGPYFTHKANGWSFDTIDRAHWHAQDQNWHRHGLIPSRSSTLSFHKQGHSAEHPNRLHRATVQVHETKITLTGHGKIDMPCKPQDGLMGLQQHPFVQEWAWELVVVGSLWELKADIQAGEGYVVSDGSFQTGKGAAAWIIEGQNQTNWIIGKCNSPSDEDGHSSFCSKLAGIFATLLTLSTILNNLQEQQKFQLACDGKSVLQCLHRANPTDPNELHTDLLSATCHVLHNCGVQVDLNHVKGHQDNKHIGPLTRDVTLNVEADLLTCDKLNTYRHGPNPFHIPWSQGVCYQHN